MPVLAWLTAGWLAVPAARRGHPRMASPGGGGRRRGVLLFGTGLRGVFYFGARYFGARYFGAVYFGGLRFGTARFSRGIRFGGGPVRLVGRGWDHPRVVPGQRLPSPLIWGRTGGRAARGLVRLVWLVPARNG